MKNIFKSFRVYESVRIFEGGHTFEGSSRIKREYIKPTLDRFLKPLFKDLGITEKDIRFLGSVGKKEYSGDIDILVNGERVAQHIKYEGNDQETDIPKHIADVMMKNYAKLYPTNYTAGLKVSNLQFPIYDETGKETGEMVQIDLMTAIGEDALEFGAFMYHSPNVLTGESKYSGAHRTSFIMSMLRFVTLDEKTRNEEFFGDEYDGKYKGQTKAFNKYSLLPKGLVIQRKDFAGKTKPSKDPKTLKEFDKIISTIPSEIAKYILGPNGKVEDLNSFESIFSFIESGVNKDLYNVRDAIYKNWVDNLPKGKEIPEEIKKYL